MPLTVSYRELKNTEFDYPFRMFISGSSQSGKTYFARQMLEQSDLFERKIQYVNYYHPDYLADRPVSWHESLSVPVTYQTGLPSMEELCEVPSHTCLVIDDLYEECINSNTVDYLFRVLSGKRNLNVIIMSQRYFARGKFGMNIRNNCNFTVLMRNLDARVNKMIARLINVELAVTAAINSIYDNNYYPYLFIDSTPRAQVSCYRCYINIFDVVKVAFNQRGMKGYILSERDFLANFKSTGNSTATRKNGQDTEIELSCQRDDSPTQTTKSDFARRLARRARERRQRRLAKSLH